MSQPTFEEPHIVVGRQEGRPAFEAHTDDSGEASGFTQFVDVVEGTEKSRIFPHTFVREQFTERGLASVLVRRALDASIREGFTIVPVCSFVASWITQHPEYKEFSTAVTPEHLKALD